MHVGDYSEYAEWMLKNAAGNQESGASAAKKQVTEKSVDASTPVITQAKPKLKFSFKEQREYDQIDENIERLKQTLPGLTRRWKNPLAIQPVCKS